MSAISSFSSVPFGVAASPRSKAAKADAQSTPALNGGKDLTPQQQSQVDALKKRDADVRQHEAAHLAAAGGLARGGASYDFQTGPDGRQYAVGGHVDIDTSPVKGDPHATLAKAQTIARAALAPADPSGQDRAVAAQAAQLEAQATQELAQQKPNASIGPSTDSARKSKPTTATKEYAKPSETPPGGALNVLG